MRLCCRQMTVHCRRATLSMARHAQQLAISDSTLLVLLFCSVWAPADGIQAFPPAQNVQTRISLIPKVDVQDVQETHVLKLEPLGPRVKQEQTARALHAVEILRIPTSHRPRSLLIAIAALGRVMQAST